MKRKTPPENSRPSETTQKAYAMISRVVDALRECIARIIDRFRVQEINFIDEKDFKEILSEAGHSDTRIFQCEHCGKEVDRNQIAGFSLRNGVLVFFCENQECVNSADPE